MRNTLLAAVLLACFAQGAVYDGFGAHELVLNDSVRVRSAVFTISDVSQSSVMLRTEFGSAILPPQLLQAGQTFILAGISVKLVSVDAGTASMVFSSVPAPSTAPTPAPVKPAVVETPKALAPYCVYDPESFLRASRNYQVREVRIGALAHYEHSVLLAVENLGAIVLADVALRDSIPAEFASVAYGRQPDAADGRNATWYFGSLAPGESKSVNYSTATSAAVTPVFSEARVEIAQPPASSPWLYVLAAVAVLEAALLAFVLRRNRGS